MLGWPEIVLILGVLLVIVGPTKLPKIARELGVAVQEFRKASSALAKSVESPLENTGRGSEGNAIPDIAKKLNIETNGKTIEQITKDIIRKIELQEKTGTEVTES